MSRRIRSEFGTLADRIQPPLTATLTPAAEEEDHVTARPNAPRHNWVLVDGTEEALLARWRRDATGQWEALVARAGGPDDVFAEWLPAARLTPYDPARGRRG